jgi:hypothetical protein
MIFHSISPYNLFLTIIALQTKRFSISLLTKSRAPEFSFHSLPSHDAVDVDVAHDDILPNFIGKAEVTMNGGVPWRGPREKAHTLLQLLIEACSLPGDVVMDSTLATG